MITKFEETKKDPTIPWTMDSLRGTLCYYVAVHENVQCYVNNNVQSKGQPIMYNNNVPSHVRGQGYTSKQGKHVTNQYHLLLKCLRPTHKREPILMVATKLLYLVCFVGITILMICVAVIPHWAKGSRVLLNREGALFV